MESADVNSQYEKFKDIAKPEVVKLQDWIAQQPHLPNISELEAFFFLHSCHGSMEMAKQTADLNFTIRTHWPEVFANRDVLSEEMRNAMKILAITPIPKGTPDGYRIIMSKFLDSDPGKFVFSDAVKLDFMSFENWMLMEGTAEGYIIACDMQGIELGHVARLGLLVMKKFFLYLQEAAPVRLKGFHFINSSPVVDKIVAMMKPFIKQELWNLVSVHSNIETFYKIVPKEILPKNYGGDCDTIENICESYYEKLRGNRDYFLEEERTKRVNEKLRQGAPKKPSDLFGMEGNFKKLEID